MVSAAIPRSKDLRSAREAFLEEVGAWVDACIKDYSDEPPNDVHDQATFTTAWEPYIRASGDRRAVGFITSLRDSIRDHFVSKGLWRHGYWRSQEAHHGTEHFQLFLGCLWRLVPDDGETVRQFLDAAEHLGNWEPSVAPWFDWETGLFRSFYFGTDGVHELDGFIVNVADHFRCANVALIAHTMSGDARYLDLASLHASRWATALNRARAVPVALKSDGPVFRLDDTGVKTYLSSVGQVPELDCEVDRAENLLASGAVEALLRLWRLTGRVEFIQAVEVLMEPIVAQLSDSDAGTASAALRAYRETTGDRRYDRAVLDAASALAPFDFCELAVEPHIRRDRRASGIGKRRDLPCWFEDGKPRTHNPILLGLAAQISGDEALAARALDISRAYFALARRVYPHGREHGCSATTVSAIARGHGRDNGAGVVTAVLGPLMSWAGRS